MIGKLTGILEEINEDHIILNVHNVGYILYLTPQTILSLPEEGEPITFFIETQVREDAIRLFGFSSKEEQIWFRSLQTVQGVGAKLALAILGKLGSHRLAEAIYFSDKAILAQAPGVGKKVADRIIVELKNKAPLPPYSQKTREQETDSSTLKRTGYSGHAQDAMLALCNLGYDQEQASHVIGLALTEIGEDAECAHLIKFGLKQLSR